MTPERWRRIEELYHAALARNAHERALFLRDACAGDDGLRLEVESLLAQSASAEAFLAEPAVLLAAQLVSEPGTSMPTGPTTASPRSRPPPIAPIDRAQFIPGAMLAARYRIVALLGRGGMGEVYRAEDLKLGQQVALKFLPEDLARNADRLARFHHEVRVARQVSHPNVCRVYDIGEADGQHFLSMEYVDGEDLASLLRRIGRLPSDKATQLGRQLCAGLAAAHDCGILHRDLKPANVLIDGRGRVRIADFGLAGLIDERHNRDILAGTPAYMAPEQLAGEAASMRTDVYALGLVLYEMFTGKPAFKISGADGFARDAAESLPTRPSKLVPEIDPAVERVIQQCIENDPTRRPPSAIAVAAALPGGDPLAAALAAGETPSPDMVAAAGRVGSLSPVVGLACVAAILLGLIPIVWMSPQTTLMGFVTMDKGTEVLAERARAIARNLGYTDRAADYGYGYESDPDYLRYINEHDRSRVRWQALRTGQPAALGFWYRESARDLVPATSSMGAIGEVTQQEPPPTASGMVLVRLDPAGRLTGLTAVPPQIEEVSTEARPPDWAALFAEAGLTIAQFSQVRPTRVPPVYADVRAAWEGVYPDRPEIRIQVEGAAARGRPVYLEIVAPWTRPRPLEPARFPTAASRARFVFGASLGLIISAGALLLARRNLRLGRGDRRGAFRLSLFLGTVGLLVGSLRAHHVADLAAERDLYVMLLSQIAYTALSIWIFYIALEPHVRRIWPETMIGWSRLLTGRFRDPLVGRDILIGTVVGILLTWMIQLNSVAMAWFGLPPPIPAVVSAPLLLGGRHALGEIVAWVVRSVGAGLVFLLSLFFFTALLRRRQIAAIAMVLILTAAPNPAFPPLVGENPIFNFMFRGLWAAGFVFVLARVGLLAAIVSVFVNRLTTLGLVTFNPSVPYSQTSYLMVGVIVVLAICGLHTAMAGRPMIRAGFLWDEIAKKKKPIDGPNSRPRRPNPSRLI
jgi:serine/threonine-protein kinase